MVFTCCYHGNSSCPPTLTWLTRFCWSQMAGSAADPSRAAVGFGRWSVPLLFGQLERDEGPCRVLVLDSLCDLIHDPERLYQTVTGGKSRTSRSSEAESVLNQKRFVFYQLFWGSKSKSKQTNKQTSKVNINVDRMEAWTVRPGLKAQHEGCMSPAASH